MLLARSFRHCEGVVAGWCPGLFGFTLDVVLAGHSPPPTGIEPFVLYMSFLTGHRTCHKLDISGKTTGPSPLVAVEPL